MNGPTLASFTTDRLVAEQLTMLHLPDLRCMDQDPQFMAYLGGIRDSAGTEQYLETNLAHWAQHGFGLWVLRERQSRMLVGRAVVRRISIGDTSEVEIGYGLLPAFWGRGLGREIARACVQIGLQRLGSASVIALAAPGNTASHRVLHRVGPQREREIVHQQLPMLLFRSSDAPRDPEAGGHS